MVYRILKKFRKPSGLEMELDPEPEEEGEEQHQNIPVVYFEPIPQPPDYDSNDYPPSYESVVDVCLEACNATALPGDTPNTPSTNLPRSLYRLSNILPPPSYDSIFDDRYEACTSTTLSEEDTQNIPLTNLLRNLHPIPYEAPPRYQSIADERQEKFNTTTSPDEEGCHHQIEATEENLGPKIFPFVAIKQSVVVNMSESSVKFQNGR
ncbi:hypothetical protein B566_EDAN003685 [Ephemera danica]|nr:hypothetical protein B566_EDAN003685 [Ephemera danica]